MGIVKIWTPSVIWDRGQPFFMSSPVFGAGGFWALEWEYLTQ